jgi:long-chain fatty acid transport protein
VTRRGLALAVVAVAGAAHANPASVFGLGARGPALAGAATAATDGDSAATYYNPAAIATADSIRIDLGYQAALPALSINGNSQGVDAARGLVAGLVVPGQVGPVRLAFGLAIHLPDEHIIRLRTLPADQPRWMYYDNRPQRFFLCSSLALQLTDDLWIGGGIAYMSRTQGAIDLTGRVGYPDSLDSDLNLSINVDLVAVRYPSAGILWRPTPWLQVGASYRGSFVLKLDQAFTLHGALGPADLHIIDDALFSLRSMSLDLFQPLELTAGFAARLTPSVLVSGDLTYARWSDYENPASNLTLSYDFKNLNSFVHIPGPAALEPAYFHDIVVPRLGVELTASERLTLRAGYSFEASPAPEQRGETNFVDADKHTFAVGAGLRIFGLGEIIPRPLDLDVFAAFTLLPDRAHRKLSPVDAVGDYVAGGHVLAGGVESRWRF